MYISWYEDKQRQLKERSPSVPQKEHEREKSEAKMIFRLMMHESMKKRSPSSRVTGLCSDYT